MNEPWPAIRYRDFYDVPRAVVVRWHAQLILLDCPFDEEADDYPPNYHVYVLPQDWDGRLDDAAVSWLTLAAAGRLVGDVPVASVHFDATRRNSVDPEVFARVGL